MRACCAPADVVVVDYLLASTIAELRTIAMPTVLLVHMSAAFRPTVAPDLVARVLVALPCELSGWRDAPANVVHVGGIWEQFGARIWPSPWAPDDARSLVVVSPGTTYMHQEDVLQRIVGRRCGRTLRSPR